MRRGILWGRWRISEEDFFFDAGCEREGLMRRRDLFDVEFLAGWRAFRRGF
jgi:hypothetical protein